MPIPFSELDPVTVATTVAVALFRNVIVGEIVGPYAVIVGCSMLGASISGGAVRTETHCQTIGHMARAVGLALLSTVPLCLILAHYTPLEPRWLLAPLAFVVGWRNKKIPEDLNWSIGWLKSKAQSPRTPEQ